MHIVVRSAFVGHYIDKVLVYPCKMKSVYPKKK